MSKFSVKLIKATAVARDTLGFHFDLQGNRFEFLPGQYINLALPDAALPDAAEPTHTFSIASSPDEPDLMVATRMTGSDYKQALAALPPGSQAQVEGPDGKFVFDVPETVPVVFLAGGIGITPFRSMLKYELQHKSAHNIRLVYSNRTPQDAPFFHELQDLAKANPKLQLLATMTEPQKSSPAWNGETGHIDANFLRKHVRELSTAVCYTAGPPKFVKAMKQALQEAGVPSEQVRAEEFPGY